MSNDSGLRLQSDMFAGVDGGGVGVAASDERVLELLAAEGYPVSIVQYRARLGIKAPADVPGEVVGAWPFDMYAPRARVAVQFWVSRHDTNQQPNFPDGRGAWAVKKAEALFMEAAARGIFLLNVFRGDVLDGAYVKAERAKFEAARPEKIITEPPKPVDIGVRSADIIKPDERTGLAAVRML